MSKKRERQEEKDNQLIKYLKEIVYSIDHIGDTDPVTSHDIHKTNDVLCNSLGFIADGLSDLNKNIECLTAQLERIADKYCESSE